MKSTVKATLDKTFEEVITVENDLRTIGFIANDESKNDSKDREKFLGLHEQGPRKRSN